MAIIRITPADRLAGKLLEKGGYTVVITEIDGPKASASNKSVNCFITFQLTKGPSAGKELKIALTSGSDSASVLGNLKWFPLAQGLDQIKAAIDKVPYNTLPINFEALDIDTDTLLQKPLDLMVGVETAEGSLINVVNSFAPAGTAMGASTPF